MNFMIKHQMWKFGFRWRNWLNKPKLLFVFYFPLILILTETVGNHSELQNVRLRSPRVIIIIIGNNDRVMMIIIETEIIGNLRF